MRLLYFDCFSGISGDMILGALVDLGVPLPYLQEGLQALEIAGISLEGRPVDQGGIRATRVVVNLEEGSDLPWRNLDALAKILNASHLQSEVRESALGIITRLAEAEACAHAEPVGQVHLHEIGALDTLADVVGAVLGCRYLKPDRILASPVEVGFGLTGPTAHGVLPVPAPATLELLKHVPIYSTGCAGELTTPTGAAILTALAEGFGPLPPLLPGAIGYGAGSLNLSRPNVLRLIQGTAHRSLSASHYGVDPQAWGELIMVCEADVDDLNPELVAAAADALRSAGALDVSLAPVIMKKGRPGTRFTLLSSPETVDRLIQILFRETSTIGVRFHPVLRRCLPRRKGSITTPFGEVAVKIVSLEEGQERAAPEYEDCARLARAFGIPTREIYMAAQAACSRTTPEVGEHPGRREEAVEEGPDEKEVRGKGMEQPESSRQGGTDSGPRDPIPAASTLQRKSPEDEDSGDDEHRGGRPGK